MNKIVVISNARFEPGLIAFINSYKRANMKTPLVIIDTGLNGKYPYETIKTSFNNNTYKRAPWMTDCSPYLQLQLGDVVDADKIIYLEVDMLLLKNIDHLFEEINGNVIATMDDVALTVTKARCGNPFHIDSAGRFFVEGSKLRTKYAQDKGWNGGLIGGTRKFYRKLAEYFERYLAAYEEQYRLLAQSLLNQYFIEEKIFVKDVGMTYNFSGINEYYDQDFLYKIEKISDGYDVKFHGMEVAVPHFTGKQKPFLIPEKNIMSKVWDYYYNNGELFNVH